MKFLFIFYFFCLIVPLFGQEIINSRPVVVTQSTENTLTKFPVKSELSIDEFINIIKFEKSDTIFTPASLIKLNQLLFSYPGYNFRVIGLNNKAAYFIERRWKAIRNYIVKTGGGTICVEILASGSLKSFTHRDRLVNIVIWGD